MIGVILIVYTTTTVMNITGFHNGQPIVDSIPEGWRIDNWSGSPLHGYVYIHNGRAFSKRMLAPCPAYQSAKDDADHAITANEVEPTGEQFSLLDAWRGFLDGTRNNVVVD